MSSQSQSEPTAGPSRRSMLRGADAAGAPLVVYLRDAASGEFDVFAGTSRATMVDPDLAARLTRAVR
jgi:hypothetical protein